MPYNTRRKSLSLPSLGIHLPGHHASRSAAHRSPPSSSSSAAATPRESPPAKRVKRSHTLGSVAPSPISKSFISKTLVSRPRNGAAAAAAAAAAATAHGPRPRPLSAAAQATPPPSPGAHHHIAKLDFDGINDDIVVGVLQQLQSTGNRPHLIKELAAVLITTLSSVESSSNPTAIISSRLTNYLRRPWTALAPCPLAKEQVAVHPRRVYYYLTTCPRQEIPEFAEPLRSGKRIISPSISSGPDEEANEEGEDSDHSSFLKARSRSPSPDLDLDLDLDLALDLGMDVDPSSGPLDFDTTINALAPSLHFHHHPPHTFHLRSQPTHHPPTASNMTDNRRAASPPLERDEREFTLTASSLLERRQTEQAALQAAQAQAQAQAQQQHPSSDDTPMTTTTATTASTTASTNSTMTNTVAPTTAPAPAADHEDDDEDEDPTSERAAQRNREAAAALFGPSHHLQLVDHYASPTSAHGGLLHPLGMGGVVLGSPLLRPELHCVTTMSSPSAAPFWKAGAGSGVGAANGDGHGLGIGIGIGDESLWGVDGKGLDWADLKSPECVELSELDDLLGGF